MAIINIFSKRQKTLRGDVPDVYVYDTAPQELRVQIINIIQSALGKYGDFNNHYYKSRGAYQYIVDSLRHEYGVFKLQSATRSTDAYEELREFILNEKDIEKLLDAVELSCELIDRYTRSYDYLGRQDFSKIANDALEEINSRFTEHGVGFQFTDNQIIRVDTQLLHAEVVKPALLLLRDVQYKGAQEEFLRAHELYRHADYKGSIAECLKSLESVLKSICNKRKWKYDPNDTSKALLQIVFEKELIPPFWQSHFSALRSTLESGVPTARNKRGGHGQGEEIVTVPTYLASYVLHLTAAAIVFLIQAEVDRP